MKQVKTTPLPIQLILPYPPSDNRRHYVFSKKLTPETLHYRNVEVRGLWLQCQIQGLQTICERVDAKVCLFPCNNRRDSTNCLKELWDSLQANKILKNDNLIDNVMVVRFKNHPSDVVIVEIWPSGRMPVHPEIKQTLQSRLSDYNRWNSTLFVTDWTWDCIGERKKIIK